MKKWLGVTAVLAVAAPATLWAEAWVPFASNRTVSGTVYRTKLWVTNSGTVERRFTTAFVANAASGTNLTGTGGTLTLPGGGTILLGTLTPNGKIGMLEVAGAPQLVINARLEAIGTDGQIVGSTQLPVVSEDNLLKAGATAHLQGAELTGRGTLTDLGVINFSRDAASCTVKAYRPNGTQIGQTVQLGFLPLQPRHFDGALTTMGQTSLSDTRFAVSCNQPFFAYALVYKAGGPETSFVVPSGSAQGIVVPAPGGSSSPGTVTLARPGTFLSATQGAAYLALDVPTATGVTYKKATVEFDLFVNRFPFGTFVGLHSLRRDDRRLFYGLTMRPDRLKTVMDMGVDDDLVRGDEPGPWKEQTNYHVFFEYDIPRMTLTFKLSRNGAVVENLSGRLNHTDLFAPEGRKLYLDFGMPGVGADAYYPPVGWIYSNLSVKLVP